MSIEKRGANSWRVGIQVDDGNGLRWVRRTVHFDPALSQAKQRKLAAIEEAKLIEEAQAGRRQPRTEITLNELVDTWRLRHASRLMPTTLAAYNSMLNAHILPELGELRVRELTPIRLTAWMDELRTATKSPQRYADEDLVRPRTPSDRAKMTNQYKPLSTRTLQHYYDTLFNIFEKCHQWELIDRNPMTKVDRPKARRGQLSCLNEQDARQLMELLGAQPDLSFRCSVALALLCGLRLGEIGGLRFSDVDFERGTIDISRARKFNGTVGSTKTEQSSRMISLPDAMLRLLIDNRDEQLHNAQLLGDRWRGSGWIVHAWDGAPLAHDTPSKQFRKFADRNGFTGIRFHDLRHTHATILLANGLDPVAVAHRLGHTDATTTLRTYAHALRRRDDEAAAVIDALVAPDILHDREV